MTSEMSNCNLRATLITEKAPGFEKMTKGVFRETVRHTVKATAIDNKHINKFELQDGVPIQVGIGYFEGLVLRTEKFM